MGPLHPLQPDRPQTHPRAPEISAWEHSSFPGLWGIILSFPRLSPARGQIIRVLLSRQPRSCTSRLAWLNRIPIAVPSGRINQNCHWKSGHIDYTELNWRNLGFTVSSSVRAQRSRHAGFLGSPSVSQPLESACSLPEFVSNSARSARLFGPLTHDCCMGSFPLCDIIYILFSYNFYYHGVLLSTTL